MRNMSFGLTVQPMRDGTKDVTRRLGWLKLKAGDIVQPVVKCMGLRKGEKIEKIGSPIIIVAVRREQLSAFYADLHYGQSECEREGFPDLSPAAFVTMFCNSHKGCNPDSMVTRIEFKRVTDQ